MDEQRLEGDAVAGTLGGAVLYEVRGMGMIVRCPGCDNAPIRPSYIRGRYLVDLAA